MLQIMAEGTVLRNKLKEILHKRLVFSGGAYVLRIFAEGKCSHKRSFWKNIIFPDPEESGIHLIKYS